MSEEGATNFSFESSLNKVFTTFLDIIDYDEIDLATFLNKKEDYKKFIFWRIIMSILVNISSFSYAILAISLFPIFPYNYILSSIFAIVMYFLLLIEDKISNHFLTKMNYSKSIYHKERNFLQKNINKLNLLINNQFLKKKINSVNYTEIINNINILKERIEAYSKVFKPRDYYLSIILRFLPLIVLYLGFIIYNTNLEIMVYIFLMPMMYLALIILLMYIHQYGDIKALLNTKKNLKKNKDALFEILKKFLDHLEETHMSFHNETRINLKINKSFYIPIFIIQILIIVIVIIISIIT